MGYLELKAETGCATVELMLVDLADFSSVRAFCDSFVRGAERLGILIQNAGVVVGGAPQYTRDGWSEESVIFGFGLSRN